MYSTRKFKWSLLLNEGVNRHWQIALTKAASTHGNGSHAHILPRGSLSRLDAIKSTCAFESFVYDIDSCPSKSQATKGFQTMKSAGARNVITFGICNSGKDSSYYGDSPSAAEEAGIYNTPLVWTLLNSGQTFNGTAEPIMKALTEAFIATPNYDINIAVALGDEPLYDNDTGSPGNLAKYILHMKSDFKNAGLPDIPISISDMPYGWQSAGDISAVAGSRCCRLLHDQ